MSLPPSWLRRPKRLWCYRSPAPTVWLASTHETCDAGTAADIDVDDAENMSVYIADWLRGLAQLPVTAVLLDARTAGAPLPDVPLTTYSPILNVTEHYRWSLGQRGAAPSVHSQRT